MADGNLLLRNVRPVGGPITDVLVQDGRVASLGQGLAAPGQALRAIDCEGDLLLPGLVDAHAHLDKTLWGLPFRPHTGGPTLAELIGNERRSRRELPQVAERASSLLRTYVAMGTTHVRTHVDVDPDAGLASIEGVFAARERFHDQIEVEVVAFPQSGMLVEPGTRDLLEAAVQAEPRRSADSTQPATMAIQSNIWTPSSPSLRAMAARSISTCMTRATWAPGRSG